ncbi:hypothetical protein KC338_g109 [Hortaea werneckii]|nr:hypothetical protein KC338_g109 [Hortaea werneckii]
MRVCRKSYAEGRRPNFIAGVPTRAGGRRPGTGFPSKGALETTRPNARCHGRLPFSCRPPFTHGPSAAGGWEWSSKVRRLNGTERHPMALLCRRAVSHEVAWNLYRRRISVEATTRREDVLQRQDEKLLHGDVGVRHSAVGP